MPFKPRFMHQCFALEVTSQVLVITQMVLIQGVGKRTTWAMADDAINSAMPCTGTMGDESDESWPSTIWMVFASK